jgi:hypothetical protein
MRKLNRREFMGVAGPALAITVIPRHVLGGNGFVAPSDKINIGLIGSGTQQLSELTRLITDERVQIVSLSDPNKEPVHYKAWSPDAGLRRRIREMIGDNSWYEGTSITAGRDCAHDFVNKYYAVKTGKTGYSGCTAYADFREMLEKESSIDAVKIIVPDHLYPTLAINSLKKGKHVIMHKPIGNRVYELRKTLDAVRNHPELITHQLAWSSNERYAMVKKWIDDGAIGTLREVHNWSYRPVWEQWPAYFTEQPPIPKGLDWDLWLGPWPDRPYHPNYTHTVYRGWFDFGAGSVADMGIYSLWPLFTTFGIDTPPVSVEAYSTVMRTTDENNAQKLVPNNVSFPWSSVFRWKFPEIGTGSSLDLFWYDGGIKPHNPPEMEADNKFLDSEGMMFVGDKGKILGGFRCENPRIIPEARMKSVTGSEKAPEPEQADGTNTWIEAVLNKQQSPGNLLSAGVVNETALLAMVALRAGGRIQYDPATMKVTAPGNAGAYLHRAEYRSGWAL